MKKTLVIVLSLVGIMGLFLFGCQKKEAPKEEAAPAMQETGGYGVEPAGQEPGGPDAGGYGLEEKK